MENLTELHKIQTDFLNIKNKWMLKALRIEFYGLSILKSFIINLFLILMIFQHIIFFILVKVLNIIWYVLSLSMERPWRWRWWITVLRRSWWNCSRTHRSPTRQRIAAVLRRNASSATPFQPVIRRSLPRPVMENR